MVHCVAFGCKNHSNKGTKFRGSFHGFPKDARLRKQWISRLSRANYKWNHYHRMCSDHFVDADFAMSRELAKQCGYRIVPLRSDAIPSRLLRGEESRRSPRKRQSLAFVKLQNNKLLADAATAHPPTPPVELDVIGPSGVTTAPQESQFRDQQVQATVHAIPRTECTILAAPSEKPKQAHKYVGCKLGPVRNTKGNKTAVEPQTVDVGVMWELLMPQPEEAEEDDAKEEMKLSSEEPMYDPSEDQASDTEDEAIHEREVPCLVVGCGANRRRGTHIFHLPKNETEAKRWLVLSGHKPEDLDQFRGSAVCSDHFQEQDIFPDFMFQLGFKKARARAAPRLREGVAPSIFVHSKLQSEMKKAAILHEKESVLRDLPNAPIKCHPPTESEHSKSSYLVVNPNLEVQVPRTITGIHKIEPVQPKMIPYAVDCRGSIQSMLGCDSDPASNCFRPSVCPTSGLPSLHPPNGPMILQGKLKTNSEYGNQYVDRAPSTLPYGCPVVPFTELDSNLSREDPSDCILKVTPTSDQPRPRNTVKKSEFCQENEAPLNLHRIDGHVENVICDTLGAGECTSQAVYNKSLDSKVVDDECDQNYIPHVKEIVAVVGRTPNSDSETIEYGAASGSRSKSGLLNGKLVDVAIGSRHECNRQKCVDDSNLDINRAQAAGLHKGRIVPLVELVSNLNRDTQGSFVFEVVPTSDQPRPRKTARKKDISNSSQDTKVAGSRRKQELMPKVDELPPVRELLQSCDSYGVQYDDASSSQEISGLLRGRLHNTSNKSQRKSKSRQNTLDIFDIVLPRNTRGRLGDDDVAGGHCVELNADCDRERDTEFLDNVPCIILDDDFSGTDRFEGDLDGYLGGVSSNYSNIGDQVDIHTHVSGHSREENIYHRLIPLSQYSKIQKRKFVTKQSKIKKRSGSGVDWNIPDSTVSSAQGLADAGPTSARRWPNDSSTVSGIDARANTEITAVTCSSTESKMIRQDKTNHEDSMDINNIGMEPLGNMDTTQGKGVTVVDTTNNEIVRNDQRLDNDSLDWKDETDNTGTGVSHAASFNVAQKLNQDTEISATIGENGILMENVDIGDSGNPTRHDICALTVSQLVDTDIATEPCVKDGNTIEPGHNHDTTVSSQLSDHLIQIALNNPIGESCVPTYITPEEAATDITLIMRTLTTEIALDHSYAETKGVVRRPRKSRYNKKAQSRTHTGAEISSVYPRISSNGTEIIDYGLADEGEGIDDSGQEKGDEEDRDDRSQEELEESEKTWAMYEKITGKESRLEVGRSGRRRKVVDYSYLLSDSGNEEGETGAQSGRSGRGRSKNTDADFLPSDLEDSDGHSDNPIEMDLADSEEEAAADSKTIECRICSETMLVEDYEGHRKLHRGVAKTLKCHLCDYEVNSYESMSCHLGKVHNNTSKLVICDQCGKEFYSISVLRVHIKDIHLRLRPHRCDLCGKAFCGAKGLLKHVEAVHHKKRPYLCEEPGCGKAFSQPWHLKMHGALHTGEKFYRCQFCDYGCVQKNSLNWHIQSKHGIKRRKRTDNIAHV